MTFLPLSRGCVGPRAMTIDEKSGTVRVVRLRQRLTMQGMIFGALLLLVSYGSAAVVTAQGSNTVAAGIHQGTCDHLGAVAFALPDLAVEPRPGATPVPVVEHMGPDTAVPILMSRTTLDVLISTLYGENHALAIARDASGQIIACGNIGGPMELQMAGMVMPGDQLVVGVGEREHSGYAGIALLTTQGLRTTITLYLLAGAAQT